MGPGLQRDGRYKVLVKLRDTTAASMDIRERLEPAMPYPFMIKALAWGWDVRIKREDYRALQAMLIEEGLDLIES